MQPVYISSAYLGPVQQYCKLYQFEEVRIETAENYLKQTYRNRCTIAAANGPLSLSVPIVKPDTLKCPTKDIRISDHGNWRHLHWNALVSAYNMSPFFEYYEEDFAPFYEKKYKFLFDFNEELRMLVCRLLDLQPTLSIRKFTCRKYRTISGKSSARNTKGKIPPFSRNPIIRYFEINSDSSPT